jgi:hypothetical protein
MSAVLSIPPAPVGSTGTSHARRYVGHVAVTPRREWVPPIDYGDGLPPLIYP